MDKQKLKNVLEFIGDLLLDDNEGDVKDVQEQIFTGLKHPNDNIEEKDSKDDSKDDSPIDRIIDRLEVSKDRSIEIMDKVENVENPLTKYLLSDNLERGLFIDLLNSIINAKIDDTLFDVSTFCQDRKIKNNSDIHNLRVKAKIIMDTINTLSKRSFLNTDEIEKQRELADLRFDALLNLSESLGNTWEEFSQSGNTSDTVQAPYIPVMSKIDVMSGDSETKQLEETDLESIIVTDEATGLVGIKLQPKDVNLKE